MAEFRHNIFSEFLEETGQDPVLEGVTFNVRYLGSCFVINPNGDEATGDAIKSIISMVVKKFRLHIINNCCIKARRTDRKLNRVALLVSVRDLKMTDLTTGKLFFDISIYR